jgi:glutamate synthase domain-containing protein 2
MLEYVRPRSGSISWRSDNEATPFSRAQRSLVYQRAKGDSDKRPFGTQLDVHAEGYEWMNHSMAHPGGLARLPRLDRRHAGQVAQATGPVHPALPRQRVQHLGHELRLAQRQCHPQALNAGAARAAFAHDTGEGSISVHHRAHGGDLIWEIGSGYFGCRNDDGSFNAERFTENAATRR